MSFKLLTVALYHPAVMKGGAQMVAKDLHDAAARDPECEAFSLSAIDAAAFPGLTKVGAAISRLGECGREHILYARNFDNFYHTGLDTRKLNAVRAALADIKPYIVHVHHSLFVGLDVLDIVREVCPGARIFYTLHEYLPICHANGHLFRRHENAICTDFSPHQCIKCFPERKEDEFILRKSNFLDCFSLVDMFIAPTEFLKAKFVEWGIPEKKIEVIPNGHRSFRKDKRAAPCSRLVNRFGFFGQYVDAKGIDVLLQAATLAGKRTEQDVEIVVYGGNKQHATSEFLERISKALEDLPKNVTVREMGSYSRETVVELMETVDWVVVPSIWPETFTLVVSEAWDARRPVIASDAGGLGERILHGKNGLKVRPNSPSSLSDQMLECLGNKQLWEKLSKGISGEISVDEAWLRHKWLFRTLRARELNVA